MSTKKSALDTLISKTVDTTWLDIKHPADGSKLGPQIEVYGMDTEYMHDVGRAIARRRQQMRNSTEPLSMEEREDEDLELLARATKSWYDPDASNEGCLIVEGQELPCTRENARYVYSHPKLRFVREQVDQHVGTRSNFIKR